MEKSPESVQEPAPTLAASTAEVTRILVTQNIHPVQRFSDRLDFSDISVTTMRDMLTVAYESGFAAGAKSDASATDTPT